MSALPYGIGTACIQAGYTPKVGEARILPIIQSTTFKYDDIEQVHRIMTLQEFGFKYTRTGNPTVAGFESKINLLEGGVGAIATTSGQSANVLAISNLVRNGDHVVSASTIYGGTYSLFNTTLPKWGVETTFIDPEASYAKLAKAFRPNTKALFVETIGNPGLNIPDFEKFARLAKEFDVPFIVDNTLATPYLFQPFKHGANIITHSATKYIDGHATSIGGVVIDGGNYNWANGKFPEFTEPDASYNGVRYTDFKTHAQGFRTHVRQGLTIETGQVLSLDVRLEVGEVAEAVTVTGDASLLESETSSVCSAWWMSCKSNRYTLRCHDDRPTRYQRS